MAGGLKEQSRAALWCMAVSSACVLAARLGSDPDGAFGGPVLHYVVLGASAVVLAATAVALLRQRRDRRLRNARRSP